MIRPDRGIRAVRTSRSVRVVKRVASVAAGVALVGAPGYASPDQEVTETVRGVYDIRGALPGAPGNHHYGNFHIDDEPRAEDFVFLLHTDYQCPGTAVPASGLCTVLRTTSEMATDTSFVLDMHQQLATARVSATFPAVWETNGTTTPATLRADLDVVGRGAVSTTVTPVGWSDRWSTMTEETRSAAATGTIAGMTFTNVPFELRRTTFR